MATQTLKERILSNIKEDSNGCWIWQLSKDKDGYGQIKLPGRLTRRAHRVSYTAFRGEFDDLLQIDHLCKNRSCVNPDHLEPVTLQENIRRGNTGVINRSKTHCPQGHEYTGGNIIYEAKNSRKCKECVYARNRIRKREWTLKRRLAVV